MAVDKNSVPKDPRPINPIRNPLLADPLLFYPASADHTAAPPSWAYHHPAAASSTTAAEYQAVEGPDDQPSSLKVTFLCSFGGRILPRPSDSALRYAGGQTRIIAVRRDTTLPGLMRKMEEACGCPVAIRYQLPDVDLDALVSVSSSEDLENMMEEYDKLAEASPDGSAKLRVLLFPPSDLATDPSSTLAHNASGLSDTGQRLYVDAVNGICSSEGSLRRKASPTQNSDDPLIGTDVFADGTNHDTSRLFFAGASNHVAFSDALMSANPLAVRSAVPAQTLNPYRPELPPLSSQQAYVDSNQGQYMNPKSLGISAGSVPINVVAIPPHAYVQISTAPVSSQVDNVNPIGSKVDAYLEENQYGGRVAQHHSDLNYKAFQPQSQLRPLPPSYLQAQNVERYGLQQVPPPPQGQTCRLEECHMCHKALPHTHLDPVIQDNGNVPGCGFPELSRVLHSHNSEDAIRVQAVQRMVPKAESTVSAVHFGAFAITQIPETHRDNERLVLTNAQSFDQGSVLCPTGAVGLSGDTQVSHGMFVNLPQSHLDDSLQQLPQASGGLSQFPAKQDAIAKPYANGVYPVKNGNIPAVEPLSWDSVLDSSYDYIRPIEGMMKVLHVNPFETSEFNGNWKPIVAPDLGVSNESIPENPLLVPVKPQVGGATMTVSNPFTDPGVILGGNCVAPIHQLQSSSLHNLQPSFTTQVARYHFNQETRVEHMVPNERLHGTAAYSCTINNACNNRISTGDQKDEASLFHPDVLNDTTAPSGGNVSIPLSNSGGITGHVEQFPEPLLSGSLFCSQDPRIFMGITHLLPPWPSWVAGKEPVIPKDLSTENCLVNSKGSVMSVLLEEGGFRQPLNSLNKDSCSELGVRATKAEEQIKQELQALAEGVAASVLESNVPPEPVFARETMESAPQSNKERGVIKDGFSLQSTVTLGDPRIEDIKTKQLDKMMLNFPITDDFGCLQIIKNTDLEELEELGSGAFGTVYHGKWKGSDVAIKRINDRCFDGKPSDQDRMMNDFWNEAFKLADLRHPNVVTFYGLVLDGPGGSVAIVTEYMVNGSLRHVLQKNDKTLDHHKRMLIAMDVAFGMEYLHDKNIVHFDLKSDNLLVNLRDPQRPICKVGDLGLSKVKCQTLISGGVRGTLPWMAPELLNGSSSMVSEKVDVFSFGIVMWELLTGEEPYADLHYGAIIGGIVDNTLRPPVPDSCDPDWRSLMERCWSSEPSERPNFMEIANKLRAIAASLPSKGQPQEQTLVRPQR